MHRGPSQSIPPRPGKIVAGSFTPPLVVDPFAQSGVGEPFGIIFRPGGVTAGNVYSTWGTSTSPGTVMYAVTQASGGCVVYVDTSIEPAVVPPGVYDGLGAAVLSPYRYFVNATGGGLPDQITLTDGATLANWNGVVGLLVVLCTCLTQPAFINGYVPTSADVLRLEFGAGITMLAGAAVPAIQVPAGGAAVIAGLFKTTLDASATPGVPVIGLGANAALIVVAYSGIVLAGDTVSGDPTTAILFEHDDTSGPFTSALFTGTLNENKTSLLDRGSSVLSSTGIPATAGFVPTADGAGNVTWSGSSGALAAIIYRPAGPAGGNVFTTSADVATALNHVNGAAIVFLEGGTFAPGCTLDAGVTWDFQGVGSISGGLSGGSMQIQVLTVEDTGQIQNVFDVIASRVICKSQTVPSFGLMSTTAGINFYDGTWLQLDASCTLAPIEIAPGGPGLFLRCDNIFQWDNSAAPTVPFISMADGTNMTLQFFRAPIPGGTKQFFPVNLFSGSALTSATINADASGWPMQTWSAATIVSELQVDDALGIKYEAANLGNWSGVSPSSVADALDRIAAHVGPIP
jgi:hypothetical protein